ncbi:MAG: hypothetical protein V2A74_02880, partial [bacterium]
ESAFVNTVAKIARDIPGGDLINFGSGRDQVVRLVLRNCVLSHCRATGPSRDAIEEATGLHSTAFPLAVGPQKLVIENCVFTYNSTRHIRFRGWGVPGHPEATDFEIRNTVMYGAGLHAMESNFGPNPGVLRFQNVRVWGLPDVGPGGRVYSGDPDLFIADLDDGIFVGGAENVAISCGSDSGDVPTTGTWDRSTVIGGTGVVLGFGNGADLRYVARDCVFGDRGTTPSAAFAGSGYSIRLDSCGVPDIGPSCLGEAGSQAELGSGVVRADPVFVNATGDAASTDSVNLSPLAVASGESREAEFWGVENGSPAPEGYADASTTGSALGADRGSSEMRE